MFYRIMYLIVTLVFSHLGFWSGNLFLIASFPDLCLLVPSFAAKFSCLFELMPSVPVNSYGHVGTLPPSYGS